MTCYFPLKGYQNPETNQLKFNPKFQDRDNWKKLTVGCGKCLGCKIDHSCSWAIRSVHENDTSINKGCFVTLTYNDQNIPNNKGINYKHIQQFMKKYRAKLRYKYKGKKEKEEYLLKYLAVGEYGGLKQRPHYHLLMYNHTPEDLGFWRISQGTGKIQYRSEELEKTWGKGFVEIGELNFLSAGYTARYSLREIGVRNEITLDKETGEVIPNSVLRCSNGIGRKWITKYLEDVYHPDVDKVIIDTGKRILKIKPPRYYDKILREIDEDRYEQIKMKREETAIANKKTDEELEAMFEVKRRQTGFLIREMENK